LEAGFFGPDICSGHRKPCEAGNDSQRLTREAGTAAQGRVLRKVRIMADSREVMNIRQASQYLGVSPDTLYKYVGEQRIPAFKLGNRWRFKKSKLDQWMEDKSSEVESRPKRKTKAAGAQ